LIAAKKMFTVIAFLVFTIGFASFAYANEYNGTVEICPFFTHIVTLNSDLSINSSGNATMAGMIMGQTGTTHIVADATLYRVNSDGTTTSVHTFRNIRAEGDMWSWNASRFVTRGHDYRLTIRATVFRNGTSESATTSSRIVRAN